MAANAEKLPKELNDEVAAQKDAFEEEQKALKEQEKNGLQLSDMITLVSPDGQDYECVVEAAPVWLARGFKLKKNGN